MTPDECEPIDPPEKDYWWVDLKRTYVVPKDECDREDAGAAARKMLENELEIQGIPHFESEVRYIEEDSWLDQEHVIEALEPVWSNRKIYECNGDIRVEPYDDEGTLNVIDELAEYTCSCGEEFDSIDEAVDHLKNLRRFEVTYQEIEWVEAEDKEEAKEKALEGTSTGESAVVEVRER